MAGNKLGPKQIYLYYTDDLTQAYTMRRDTDLAVAGLGAGAAAPQVYDRANPPENVDITPAPKGFSPRVVFIQDPTGARKNMIAFHPTSQLYLKQFSDSFPAIDGQNDWFTTGRKGEQATF